MTPERFCALLDAYGSDIRRWPEAERESARALAARDLPELRERLAEAAALDGWLDSAAVNLADEALARRIAADAAIDVADHEPVASTRTRWWQTRWWLPGAGLAVAGLAGSIAGALVVSAALRVAAPPATTDWPERATAFNELPADWSDE